MGYAARRYLDDAQARRKPAGGFVFITGTALLSAWEAYRGEIATLLDLRVWLACSELVARRCAARQDRTRKYTAREIMVLVGSRSESSIRRAISRLERAGLLAWSDSSITVGQVAVTKADDGQPQPLDYIGQVSNHARRIPVPRRIVRLLAREGTKVQIATVFGHLLRCLYYRQGRCRPSGMCKASWIAAAFGVDARNAKAARKELVRRGILMMEPCSQWFLNRHGPLVTVNLAWGGSPGRCRRLPPPRGVACRSLPPPIREPELLRIKNQKPPGAATGVRVTRPENPPPSLRHVVPADLVSPARLAVLHDQAREVGYVNGSEADRLKFFAAAEHAKAIGSTNTPGLFATIVCRRLWSHITQVNEDRARAIFRSRYLVWYNPVLTQE